MTTAQISITGYARSWGLTAEDFQAAFDLLTEAQQGADAHDARLLDYWLTRWFDGAAMIDAVAYGVKQYREGRREPRDPGVGGSAYNDIAQAFRIAGR